MTVELSDYEKQAIEVLEKLGATVKTEFLRLGKHFDNDKEDRLIYKFTITKGTRSYSGEFGGSLYSTEEAINKAINWLSFGTPLERNGREILHKLRNRLELPIVFGFEFMKKVIPALSAYNVIASLTKHDPGTFENFCDEFGYDTDSRAAEKIYNAVKAEYQGLAMLFSDDELSLLSEVN